MVAAELTFKHVYDVRKACSSHASVDLVSQSQFTRGQDHATWQVGMQMGLHLRRHQEYTILVPRISRCATLEDMYRYRLSAEQCTCLHVCAMMHDRVLKCQRSFNAQASLWSGCTLATYKLPGAPIKTF